MFDQFKRYYDTFLMRYQELAKEKGWSQPLLGNDMHIFRNLASYILYLAFLCFITSSYMTLQEVVAF
jgi:hypothetical protein